MGVEKTVSVGATTTKVWLGRHAADDREVVVVYLEVDYDLHDGPSLQSYLAERHPGLVFHWRELNGVVRSIAHPVEVTEL